MHAKELCVGIAVYVGLQCFHVCFTVNIYSVQITARNKEGHSAVITDEASTKCKKNLFSFRPN